MVKARSEYKTTIRKARYDYDKKKTMRSKMPDSEHVEEILSTYINRTFQKTERNARNQRCWYSGVLLCSIQFKT